MTKLLDTGMLETDAWVVAACFRGMEVQQIRTDLDEWHGVVGVLQELRDNDMPFLILVEDENCLYEADRILIPARVVAEKTLDARYGKTGAYKKCMPWMVIVTVLFETSQTPGPDLELWLREHVKE